MNDRTRVVVTGMGAVTPLGNTVQEFWDGLVAGRSGITPMTLCDPSPFPCQIAGEVKGFDPGAYVNPREARRMARFSQLALASAHMAIEDAGIDLAKEDQERVGVLLGTGIGSLPTTQETCQDMLSKGGMKINPFFIPMILPNMAAANIARVFGAKGYNLDRHHRLCGVQPVHRRGRRGHPPRSRGCRAVGRHRGRNQRTWAFRLLHPQGPQHPKRGAPEGQPPLRR